jgi:Uma2 family endonuclease
MTAKQPETGPYRAEDIRPGERYELDDGYLVFYEPGGGSHAKPNLFGGAVVGFDPKVTDVGVDPGFTPRPHQLRAPDVAVGNVPDKPGWIQGVPELAIEYADVGQNEVKLQTKIRDLLAGGTKYLWVVRLTGPRRVEIYEPGCSMRLVYPGEYLSAPGVLQNQVLVQALYDRGAAERATLTNLLQRQGYADIEAVLATGRAEGEASGRAEGLRVAVRDLCQVLGIEVTAEREASLGLMRIVELDDLRERLKRDRGWK